MPKATSPEDVDLSEFEALEGQQGPRCSVCQALEALPPKKAAQLLAAFARNKDVPGRRRIKHTSIAKWLNLQGFEIDDKTVARHRRGSCVNG